MSGGRSKGTESDDERDRAAIDWLNARGYLVTAPPRDARMMTPGAVAQRLGMAPQTLHCRLNMPGCPLFLHTRARFGEGRIKELFLDATLEAFLRQPIQPGKRLAAVPRFTEALA